MEIVKEIIKRTFRVPLYWTNVSGNGEKAARQLDAALMKAGFKFPQEMLVYLGELHPALVTDIGKIVISAVRELVGDHVRHNVYFRDFPNNVPDTVEFWAGCIADALLDPDSADKVFLQLSFGVVNLLDLPKYGKYQYSYEAMVAAHDEFMPLVKNKAKVLHLGKSLPEETLDLYYSLAGSRVPLNESDRKLLETLAEVCVSDEQPEKIPVRENKAVINLVRLQNSRPILADTPTDVLRLACALSEGDVTLDKLTKFKSFKRSVRGALMKALDRVIEKSPAKLADINQYSERWKRLGERLHPHEYNSFPYAQDVFAVARGEKKARSLAGKVEMAFADGDVAKATSLLGSAPGMLFRNLDRILRNSSGLGPSMLDLVIGWVEKTIPKVSGRVILSVREHLQNRLERGKKRVFANNKGKAWVADETRDPLDESVVSRLLSAFDAEISKRIPVVDRLIVDPAVMQFALPLSDKNKAEGFGVMPRGSTSPVDTEILRFFVYWKQHHERTDYDLSVIMLDRNFGYVGQSSWTNLRDADGTYVHSGDITEAPNGALEFIDIDLPLVNCSYIIPQVNVFSGESFDKVEESFFGFMERTTEQKGKPFEARTVRMKSDMRGKGKVALPLVFMRNEDGTWEARWMHLYLNGSPNFNRVEGNRVSTTMLARAILERKYLSVKYLIDLAKERGIYVNLYEDYLHLNGSDLAKKQPVTFIGIEAPENLPAGSKVYTLSNLHELIPA